MNTKNDKFDESGPWQAVFEGETVALEGDDYCKFFKEGSGKYKETHFLPCDLRIKSGRKIRLTIEVLE